MVYVNSKKFACESCIKGHRSSSCHHTDRPLFEIKKKGRPVSQCDKCRELRQSKRVHSKCTCSPAGDDVLRNEPAKPIPGTKSRRFIPIEPALPNGLRDVLQASKVSSSTPADARQRVDTLLNPCNCKSVWKCKCRTAPISDTQGSGLETLARVAVMCCNNEASTSSPPVNKSTKRKLSRLGSPSLTTHKRLKHITKSTASPSPGPELPPIQFDISVSPTGKTSNPLPDFPVMPPMSEIASFAGSGCTCGVQCACPGCVEHRGAEHASKERNDCADGCGTCIDSNHGVALPGHDCEAANGVNTSKFLDKFFARAAALPLPPTNRRMGVGVDIDPMNIMVYPGAARATDEGGFAFGLVSLPKLECCGGRCACPTGRCGCGKLCDGSCANHGRESQEEASKSVRTPDRSPALTPMILPVRSCCAGKAVTV
ncbi:hypothetical protein BDZ94DRAFT_1205886 [Collybia nuda]|uniref:Copper-fist domain-containing protein n=1 Tax=Collybia nuda TaxID=64659 RepID=A0A9P6CBR5_9AGAR|nr:hypothetical protein BDZ94DRAFT_1205886 [Collybia nuda]